MARRQRGEGAVFRRADGRYVGQVELDIDHATGKRRRRTIYGRSTADVVKKMAAARRQLAERGDLPTDDMTVAKWLTYWLEEVAKPKVKPGVYAGYRSKVNQYLIPHLGRYRLNALSAMHVRAMHKAMLTTPRPGEKEPLKPLTVAGAHRVLSSALEDAVKWNRVPRNVAKAVDPPRADDDERGSYSAAEAVAILNVAAKDQRLGSTWLAMLMLGLRASERLGLRWSHVDLDAGTIDITWTLHEDAPWRHGCDGKCGRKAHRCPDRALDLRSDLRAIVLETNRTLQDTKTKKSRRVIPLPGPLIDALRHRYEQVQAERPGYTVDHDLVWCREDGGPIPMRSDWAAWRKLLGEAGVDVRTRHEGRYTAASLLRATGADQETIRSILGHATIVVTRGYQDVDLDLARKALDNYSARLALPG